MKIVFRYYHLTFYLKNCAYPKTVKKTGSKQKLKIVKISERKLNDEVKTSLYIKKIQHLWIKCN